ncbi:YqaJ viral recombinase family protein [bacterium]|nr:YqaJ viral recombinase family protein [bacterium]
MSEDRKNFIGGSDIAAVMGMSRWKTPLTLWLEKTGEVEPKDLSDNEAVQLGKELEEFVAQQFSKKTGLKVRKRKEKYTHKKYPFMVAHVDRLIVGSDELLECKTCGSFKKDEWKDDEIPTEYILQVVWYLGITGRKKGHIAVLIGGQSFKYKEINFDQELFNIMVDMAIRFWECVQTKTMPAITPDDNDIMAKVYPTPEQEFIQDQELESKIEKLVSIKADMTSLDNERKMLEAELKNIINTHAGILTDKYKLSWFKVSKSVVDTEKLRADKLYEKYSNISESRTLRVFANKKKAA